jgi:hypothetical protein
VTDVQPDAAGSPRTIRRLVGVYNADGSVRGELSYFVGARLGRAHCSLCDITHGLVRERAEWRTCRASFPVPFDTYHRDDEPTDARAAHHGRLPVVLADTSDGFVELLGPDALEACAGSVSRLAEAIDAAATAAALSWL